MADGSASDPGSTGPDFFESLEHQFNGVEERVKAELSDELRQTAAGLKGVISNLFPDVKFEPIMDPSYANGGIMAEDGKPLVLQPVDAYKLAKEDPDFAAVIALKAHTELTAERQQIEVDLEDLKHQPPTEGTETARQELLAELSKLDYKADRIEFWSAVALLHPFGKEEIEPYFTDTFWGVHNFDSRVFALTGIEQEYHRLVEQNSKHTPGMLDAYLAAHGDDPADRRWIEGLRDHRAHNAVAIQRYERLMTDICYGRLTTAKPDMVREVYSGEISLSPDEQALQSLPGMDPLKMTINGRLAELPANGWLIDAELKPGKVVSFTVHAYKERGFRVSGLIDSTSVYGEAYMSASFQRGRFGNFAVAYGKKDSQADLVTNNDVYNDVVADGDNELRFDTIPMHTSIGTAFKGIHSNNIEQVKRYFKGKQPWRYNASRVTDSPEELQAIIDGLLSTMEASEAVVARLKTELTAKKLFEGLKPMEPKEKNFWDKVIDSRRPVVETYDHPYDEGY